MAQGALRPTPVAVLDRLLDGIIVFSLGSVALLLFMQVILRYVMHVPFLGMEELCYFPTIWLYLFGAAKSSSGQSQLVARVCELACRRQRTAYALRAVAALCSSLILLWLTYWACDYLLYSLRMQKETSSLYLPWIYAEASVALSMGLMLLYTVLELRQWSRLVRSTDATVPAGREAL